MTEKSATAYPEGFCQVWWLDPWWEDPEYQRECNLTLEQIRDVIDALKVLFNLEWMTAAVKSGPPNVVLAILYGGKGLWPFQDLMWLGAIAKSVARMPNVRLPLNELSGQKSWSALFELEVASWFGEQNWKVEFLKPGSKSKTPDLKLERDGISTAIECKRFGSEQWEDWSEELSLTLIRDRGRYECSNDTSVDILFEPRLSDVVPSDKVIRKAIQDELAERIGVAVRDATSSVPPHSVDIPGVAKVRIRPDLKGGGIHEIGGISVSPQAKMRRIAVNGVIEAARQLDNHAPGGVVIKSDFTPPIELVDVVLRGLNRADESILQSVATVVIAGFDGSRPIIWQNPLFRNHPASDALLSTFGCIFQKGVLREAS